MSTWISSGATAIAVGSVAFLILFIPTVVWHVRRYGQSNFVRLFGGLLLAIYLSALVTYTLMPLPPREGTWCAQYGYSGAQLTPFQFVSDIRRETAGLSVRRAVLDFSVLQVAMNILLFIPWGVFARRYFDVNVAVATMSGLVASLAIEATQYTGLWGIYDCAYRLADVDDLMINTAGAFIGALIAPAVMWWMPNARALATTRLQPRAVTGGRRLLGMIVDVILYAALVIAMHMSFQIASYGFTGEVDEASPLMRIVIAFLAWIVVFAWPAWNGTGASAGQAAVWLAPVWNEGGRQGLGTRTQRLLRVMPVQVFALLSPVVGLGTLALFLGVAASFVSVFFTRGHRGLSGVLLGATIVDARTLGTHEPAARPSATAHR